MKLVTDWPDELRYSRYDWARFMDGEIRVAERGIDFKGQPEGFRSTVIQAARRRDIAVRTRVERNKDLENARWYVRFQFFPGRTYTQGPPAQSTSKKP